MWAAGTIPKNIKESTVHAPTPALTCASVIPAIGEKEIPHSDLIRKYFSAYENKDRKAVESLLTNDFVFTSRYDYRIDRETYFKRCQYTEFFTIEGNR
jgi:hypothetical protein